MQVKQLLTFTAALAFAPFLSLPAVAANNTVANPICPDNTANFNPTLPPSIDLPPGFTASVFVSGLNFPTGIAFLGDCAATSKYSFSNPGTACRSVCNEQVDPMAGRYIRSTNPFTPDILVFNRNGRLIRGPLGQAHVQRGRVPARRARRSISGSSTASREGGSSRPTPISRPTARWTKQQFAHRHREPDDRAGHAVHHRPADGRPPDRTARVQRRMDLLVARIDDQQRRRRSRQWRRRRTSPISRARTSR